MRFSCAALVVGLVAVGCGRAPVGNPDTVIPPDKGPATSQAKDEVNPDFGEIVVGQPVSHENLTIFPIVSKVAKNQDRFITLDEGLAAGTVKIMEVGALANEEDAAEIQLPAAANPDLRLPIPVPDTDTNANPNDSVVDENDAERNPPARPSPAGNVQQAVLQQPAAEADSVATNSADEASDDPPGNIPPVAAARPDEEVDPFVDDPVNVVSNQPAEDQLPGQDAAQESGNPSTVIPLEENPILVPQGLGGLNGNIAQGPGGEVNRLLVVNTSNKPLYLMPGEIIYGGKQNRTIGEELVIQPGGEPVSIEAYCVEKGRWSGRSIGQTTQQLAQANELSSDVVRSLPLEETGLAQASRQGQFVATIGNLNKQARMAVQAKKGQSEVWKEVAITNARVGNPDTGGDFSVNYLNKDVHGNLKPYVDGLSAVGETEKIVGVAMALDGKVVSVDVFESTPLFRKFWPKLLKSYALDAAASRMGNEDKPSAKCDLLHCVSFIRDMEKGQTETEEKEDGQMAVRRKSKRGLTFALYSKDASAGFRSEDGLEFGEASVPIHTAKAIHVGSFEDN